MPARSARGKIRYLMFQLALYIVINRVSPRWRVFFSKVWLHFFFQRFGSTPPFRFLVTVIILDSWIRKVSTVTGIAGVRVAILITVDVFRLSDGVRNSKMSTVTGIVQGRLAIRVTVDDFRLLDAVLNSKMSTVTGIAEGMVAILATVDVFGLSYLLGDSKCLRMRCYKYERGGWGGGSPPPICKHRIGRQSVTSC